MGKGSSTTTTTQQLSPEQQQLLDLVIPAATDISQNTPELFPGSAIAGFNPLETSGQQSAVNAATGSVQDLVNSTISGSQNLQSAAIPAGVAGLGDLIAGGAGASPARDFILSGNVLSPDSNPFLRQTAEGAVDTLSDNLLTKVLPSIRRGAQTAGQVGSSRQGIAEGLAINDFNQTAGQVTSDIYNQGYGQGLGSFTSTLSDVLGLQRQGASDLLNQGTRSLFAAPELSSLALDPSRILSAVGGQQRGLEQSFLTEEADRFLQEQIMPFLVAQDVANLAFGVPGGTTTSTGSTGGSDIFSTLIGIGSLLAGSPLGLPF